jgi:hypothetical protein
LYDPNKETKIPSLCALGAVVLQKEALGEWKPASFTQGP